MDFSSLKYEASRLGLYTNKHKGLFLYTHRILRPIWEMKITQFNLSTNLEMQKFNIEPMIPVRDRL